MTNQKKAFWHNCGKSRDDEIILKIKNMLNFWNKKWQGTLDAKNLTPDRFDEFLKSLYKIPESDWYDGRRTPVLNIIEEYKKLYPNNVNFIRPEIEPNRFLSIIKIEVKNVTYVYFDEFTIWNQMPVINWFQIEKQDKSLGNNIYRTILLLSSDNDATTQGSMMLMLFDSLNK